MAFLRVSLSWALSRGKGEQAGHVCVLGSGIWKQSLCLGVDWKNCVPLLASQLVGPSCLGEIEEFKCSSLEWGRILALHSTR